MSVHFLDSSALIKRYIDEPGSAWVREITDPGAGHVTVVSAITRVEIVSGIMRLRREGALTDEAATAIRHLTDLHTSTDFIVIALADELADLAEDLLERLVLRADDALQLASALASSERFVRSSLEFVSADVRLLAAAVAEGMKIIDPTGHTWRSPTPASRTLRCRDTSS